VDDVVDASDELIDAERDAYQLEIDQLVGRIDNVVNTTSFNGQPLLRDTDADGEISLSFTAVDPGDAELTFDAVAPSDLGTTDATLRDLVSGGSHSLSSGNFTEAFEAVDAAVTQVATAQATVGSFQAYTAEALENVAAVAAENAAAARSAVEDADFAKESADMMLEENRFRALTALTRRTNTLQRESLLTLLNPAA
ncbi:MAG: flagellin, partial [Planctomycetota bacterium]